MTEPEPVGARLRRWDPERIGPYVILGRLGAGSMGQVFLGRSAAGRLVAVKTIRVELAEEAGFRNRFAQEVAAARKVSGFFTAAVVEADPEADLPWLATAYVAAPSLSRLVRACGPLPVAAVRWLAAGCAEALDSIHRVGLVHRDLKPSNVLVAPDGPRVIDFGVARAAERMSISTSHGTVGTPAYMAPEQAHEGARASAASDVYSLGATLVFAATGHPPYRGDTVMDVLARLATEEPDLSALPAELAPLVAACMRREPAQRLTSAALLAQLGHFAETRPGAAGEHSYLPGQAMALVAQYQRNPLLAAGPAGAADPADPADTADNEDSADATAPSYTELPASDQPGPGLVGGGARHRTGPASSRAAGGWRQWLRGHLAWVGWVSVGAALVVTGRHPRRVAQQFQHPVALGPTADPGPAGHGVRDRPRRLRAGPVHGEAQRGHLEYRVRAPGEPLPARGIGDVLPQRGRPAAGAAGPARRDLVVSRDGGPGRDVHGPGQRALSAVVQAGRGHGRCLRIGRRHGQDELHRAPVRAARRLNQSCLSSRSTTGLPAGTATPGRPAGRGPPR